MDNERNEECEDAPEHNTFYEMLKKKTITEPENLIRVVTADSSTKDHGSRRSTARSGRSINSSRTLTAVSESGPKSRSSRQGLGCGDHFQEDKSAETELVDDGCIKIHSLSSNASILVPETHRVEQQVREKVLKYENNFVRPRTALSNTVVRKPAKTTSSSARKIKTASHPNEDDDHARPSTSSIVTPMRSQRTLNSDDEDSDDYSISSDSQKRPDEDNHSRTTSYQSRHALVRPGSRNMTGTTIAPSDYSTQPPGTSSYEIVHRGYCRSEDEKIEKIRNLVQLAQESYNEWRDGMEDPTELSRKLRETAEKLYSKELRITAEKTEIYLYKVLFSNMLDLLDDFALLPTPPGHLIRCRITRSRKGIDGAIFPQYFMHLQRNREPDVLLLTARKHKPLSTSYLISTDPADISLKSPHCIGILKANMRGKVFNLFTPDKTVMDTSSFDASTMWTGIKSKKDRENLMELSYESNPLGFKGPRRIKISVPKLQSDHQRATPGAYNKKPNPLAIDLVNRDPLWNPQSNSFILNFRGRVQLASVKNFQIIHPDMPQHTILQFGRYDRADSFILDFGCPLCPLQAFAIALSSFDVKWGLE